MTATDLPPHTLPAGAAAALGASAAQAGGQPPGWCPFGPPELGLWVGPNLAVATPGWRVTPPEAARALLLRHALTRSGGIDAALTDTTAATPYGTPFADAVRAHARALPGFACVLSPDGTEAAFVRAPEAVLQLGAGRLGELESGSWRTGADALGLLLQHRQAWEPAAGGDVLLIRPDAPEGLVLRRALVLGLGGLVTAPVLAAPVLLADAVLWFITIALLWVVLLATAPALLRAWDRHRPQPALRLDPWRLWLPAALGPGITDRTAIEASMSWRKAFGTATTGTGGRAPSVRNPAMTYLHLRGPELRLKLGCEGEPSNPAGIPLAQPDTEPGTFAGVPRSAFWQLAARLVAPRGRGPAAPPSLSRPAR
jgi:hypothetical protein